MKTKECYARLHELLAEGNPAVTATVIRTKGSTPREPGAKMLIGATGKTEGTIGGGCGEADVLTVAKELLEAGSPETRMVRVDLTEEILEASERICGGIMDIAVECWTVPVPNLDLLSGTRGGGAVRIIDLTEPNTSGVSIFPDQIDWKTADIGDHCRQALKESRSHIATVKTGSGERELFFEYASSDQSFLICGAGHIAQPLSQIAKMLDYRVVVIDDRPIFASQDRFPEADEVLAEPFQSVFDKIEITEDTHAVMVTRGHRYDEYCLRRLLKTPASYLGLLGSRRRVRAVYRSLLEEGFGQEELSRIYGPVGIDIGSQTPAEIALSIMAELVAIKRGRLGGHMRARIPKLQRARSGG
jgi:xanthine dehydrogenase accessory factor